MSIRSIIFQAISHSLASNTFAQEFLQSKREQGQLKGEDYPLAIHMVQGYFQHQEILKFYLDEICSIKLPKKKKEKVCLSLCLYEYIYLSTPTYALCDEWVEVAKKLVGWHFSRFINKQIRSWSTQNFRTPIPTTTKLQALVFSVPEDFIELLSTYWSFEQVSSILKASLKPKPLYVRELKLIDNSQIDTQEDLINKHFNQIDKLPEDIKTRFDIYVQNPAQFLLLVNLWKNTSLKPSKVLDACAAPGGKALFLSRVYSDAVLTTNDINPYRLKKLVENQIKYSIEAKMTNLDFLEFPEDSKYDLIIIDAPCSNSGVLSKRAEARHRLTDDVVKQLKEIQRSMILKAASLLTEDGVIWYLTCSILPQENHLLLEEMQNQGLIGKIKNFQYIKPDNKLDGGFGALIL